MCEIIHGIYIPFRSGTMMRMLDNTVHNRIAEVHIGRSHVYFRTQDKTAFLEFALIHSLEQIEIFLYASIPIRAFYSRLCGSTLLAGYLFRRLFVDIGFTLLD